MRQILQTVRKFSMLAAGFALLSISSNAADVIVEPGFNTLSDAVTANPGSTFILERGGEYLIDVDIAIDDVTIFKAADGDIALAPPMIQYFANPGEAGGKKPFMLGASTTFEGLGFFGITPGGEMVSKYFTCTAPDIEVTFDGCVFQVINHILEFGKNDNNKYVFKNNRFFNICTDGWDNYGGYISLSGGVGVDFNAYNNTYFMTGRIHNASGVLGNSSQTMNHNTYVNTFGDVFHYARSQDYIATNNIFYNAQIRGYVGVRYDAAGDTIWKGDYLSWKVDTLGGDISIFPHANDSLDNTGQRIVSITNNLKMYDQTVMDFYNENIITPMTLWNRHGREVYGPRYGWEYKDNYLQEDGNAIDPEFAMGDLPAGSYTYHFLTRKERDLPAEEQGPDFPYKIVYLPEGKLITDFIWPLPYDLKPTNTAVYELASDGYPVGDLSWFGADVVDAWEKGLPNPLLVGVRDNKLNELNLKSYPNPFNSLTNISYDLPTDGIVTISIFSVSGAKVAQVANEYQSRGQHEVVFNGSNLSSGIYFCKVQVGNFSQFGKLSIVR